MCRQVSQQRRADAGQQYQAEFRLLGEEERVSGPHRRIWVPESYGTAARVIVLSIDAAANSSVPSDGMLAAWTGPAVLSMDEWHPLNGSSGFIDAAPPSSNSRCVYTIEMRTRLRGVAGGLGASALVSRSWAASLRVDAPIVTGPAAATVAARAGVDGGRVEWALVQEHTVAEYQLFAVGRDVEACMRPGPPSPDVLALEAGSGATATTWAMGGDDPGVRLRDDSSDGTGTSVGTWHELAGSNGTIVALSPLSVHSNCSFVVAVRARVIWLTHCVKNAGLAKILAAIAEGKTELREGEGDQAKYFVSNGEPQASVAHWVLLAGTCIDRGGSKRRLRPEHLGTARRRT